MNVLILKRLSKLERQFDVLSPSKQAIKINIVTYGIFDPLRQWILKEGLPRNVSVVPYDENDRLAHQ